MNLNEKKTQYFDDEPTENSNLFKNDALSSTIKEVILDSDLPTPFAICIDGEWGEGKSSLLKSVCNKVSLDIKEDITKTDEFKVLWFNAWEYERLDPVAALLYLIQELYKDGGDKLKKTAISVGRMLFDMAIRAHTNMDLNDLETYFRDSVKGITSIKDDLQETIKKGKLIIFIDDLDRCIVEKTLEMLEALKIFLNSKNVIVVLAADIQKLERAWELRYNKLSTSGEGRDHIDKIFQLKISLPSKEEIDLKKYLEVLKSPLSPEEEKLIVIGCKNNPRKIKKIFNLLNFSKRFKSYKTHHEVTTIILWYTLGSVYHQFFKVTKDSIPSLITVLIILHQFKTFEDAKNKLDNFMHMEPGVKGQIIPLNENFRIPKDHIFHEKGDASYPDKIYIGKTALEMLSMIRIDRNLFEFLYVGAKELGIEKLTSESGNIERIFSKYKDDQVIKMEKIIQELVVIS